MRIPMTSISSAPGSTKPAPFSSFNLRDDSPMSIPSPSPNVTQSHRRLLQSEHDELIKLNKTVSTKPQKRSTRVIESDDETSPHPKSTMGLLAATSHANTSNANTSNSSAGWVKARDPISMSNNQRNRNIMSAQVETTLRKPVKHGTIQKIKSTQIQQTLNLVDDDEEDDTSADEDELGGTLSGDMTRALTSLHRNRPTANKDARDARLQGRQSKRVRLYN